jgi:hypothetical protein
VSVTKWKLGWGGKITSVEVVRETEHSVWRLSLGGKEIRDKKRSHYSRYYDSFEEARDHQHTILKETVERCEMAVRSATANLKEFEEQYGLKANR